MRGRKSFFSRVFSECYNKNMKNIIFDFGGVLVDWNPRHLYRKIFSSEEEMEYFLTQICNGEWNARQDAGRPFAQAVAELQKQYPQYAAQIAVYFDRWEEMLGGEIPGMADLVRTLKRKGYKLYGLTNWSAETFPVARAKYAVFDALDGMVVSGEEKVIKPDPEIYKCLLSRFQLRAPDCLFIDDSPANVAAARQLGFDAVRFENAAALERELKRRNML